MNKAELVGEVAEAAELSKKDAEAAVNAFLVTVQAAVKKGDKVTIPGFGAWSRTERKARIGRNPRTGEPVKIAASKGVKFSVGASFKSLVSGK